jgi:signal transduction histidine kinase
MFHSIQSKLTLAFFGLILIIQISSSIVHFVRVRQILGDSLKLEAENLSTPLYQSFKKNLNYAEIEEDYMVLRQMEQYGNIRLGVNLFPKLITARKKLEHIQFVDLNGSILGHDLRELRGKKVDRKVQDFINEQKLVLYEHEDKPEVFVPFMYRNKFYGGLIFIYSNDQFVEENSRIFKTVFSFFIIYLIIGYLGSWAISSKILNPIESLSKAFERISQGNLDEKINTKSKGELGRLARSFSTMRESIRDKIKLIEEYNRTLEQKVGERTESLRLKNKEIEESEEQLRTFSQKLQEKNELIREQNHTLEATVAERTEELSRSNQELQSSLETLRMTQKQLVDREKMAALGGLVAGVAHEINTPIGIGVSLASYLNLKTDELTRQHQSNELYQEDLDEYLQLCQKSNGLILRNLNRAFELITSFKQIAVDQSSEKVRSFYLKAYVDEIMVNLQVKLKKTKHTIEVEGDESIKLKSYPGAFSQIFTNLVMNSINHAFTDEEAGKIKICLAQGEGLCEMVYSDNGKGIPQENQKFVFDPFFTTKRVEGGSGLGLHIIYNIVNQQLAGDISLESTPGKGCSIKITFPLEGKTGEQ